MMVFMVIARTPLMSLAEAGDMPMALAGAATAPRAPVETGTAPIAFARAGKLLETGTPSVTLAGAGTPPITLTVPITQQIREDANRDKGGAGAGIGIQATKPKEPAAYSGWLFLSGEGGI